MDIVGLFILGCFYCYGLLWYNYTKSILHHNCARKLFYAMSDTMVVDDCGYDGPEDQRNALNCKMPEGHICLKCAHKTQGGKEIKMV